MRTIITILFLFLTGCATAPENALSLNEVSIPEPTENQSIFVFYRPYTPPIAYDMRVSINDKQVVSLPNNTFSYVQLPPGEFNLKTHWSPWSGMWSKEEKLEIKPSQKLFLKLGSSVWTPTGIELGSGKNELQDEKMTIDTLKLCCKYIKANEEE
jgi:hypothetical protein